MYHNQTLPVINSYRVATSASRFLVPLSYNLLSQSSLGFDSPAVEVSIEGPPTDRRYVVDSRTLIDDTVTVLHT